jgi:hypothetical protein
MKIKTIFKLMKRTRVSGINEILRFGISKKLMGGVMEYEFIRFCIMY